MKLDITPIQKALAQLEKSLAFYHSDIARKDPEIREQFRAACIQAFEFNYELAYKFIRRQLAQIVPSPQSLVQMAFPDLIRSAADAGMIPDVKRFLIYRDKRNLSSHAYDIKKAEEVISVLSDFLKDMQFLVSELKRRNV
jgi:nucleotidyltransferase substrate binding protein (TIGR01987 family)